MYYVISRNKTLPVPVTHCFCEQSNWEWFIFYLYYVEGFNLIPLDMTGFIQMWILTSVAVPAYKIKSRQQRQVVVLCESSCRALLSEVALQKWTFKYFMATKKPVLSKMW